MTEATLVDVVEAAVLGGVVSSVGIALLIILYMSFSFQRWVKDDVGMRKRAYLTVRWTPYHVYSQTHWKFSLKLIIGAGVIGAAVFPLLLLMGIGIVEVAEST